MKAVILAFTLKDQDFDKIAEAVKSVKNFVGEDYIVIHGFMPRAEVIEKGFDTKVVDLLESTFDIRLNMYKDGKPLRKEMVEVGVKLNARVVVVGEIRDGVKEEVDMYVENGLTILQKLLA